MGYGFVILPGGRCCPGFSFVFFIGVCGCVRSGIYQGEGVASSLVDSHTVVLAELTWVNLLAMRQPNGWNEFWATPPSGPHVRFCCAINPISVCLRRIVDLAPSIFKKVRRLKERLRFFDTLR